MVKELRSIKKKLKSQETQIDSLSKDVGEVKTYLIEKRRLEENVDIISFDKLCSLHDLTLPFQNLENFKNFEENLETTENLKDNLVRIFSILCSNHIFRISNSYVIYFTDEALLFHD